MATTEQKVDLKLDHAANLDFKWQMYFNRFSIEEVPEGKIASFAYQKSINSSASEIVPVFIPHEGLKQLKESSTKYLPAFVGTEDPGEKVEALPDARRFSPMFGNHIRLSRSGQSAEIAIFSIMLTILVDRLNGKGKTRDTFPLIPVALLHSSIPVHYRFICKLLDGLE